MPTDEDTQYDGDEIEKPGVRDYIKKLEGENQQLKDEGPGVEALQRENAFLKAGIDLDAPMSEYFIKGYDGDLDADAIKAEAAKVGVLGGDGPEPTPEQDATISTHQSISEAVSADPVNAAGKTQQQIADDMWAAKSPAEIERIARAAGVPYKEG
jgi:hypothetical protein